MIRVNSENFGFQYKNSFLSKNYNKVQVENEGNHIQGEFRDISEPPGSA